VIQSVGESESAVSAAVGVLQLLCVIYALLLFLNMQIQQLARVKRNKNYLKIVKQITYSINLII
jgi:hypothetical protein